MAGFKLNRVSGILPRIPESLLPEGAATIAQNCDFAYGELRNTKNGFGLLQMSNVAKSLYTDDGVAFFSWDSDVDAVRSPLAKDKFNRLYYSGDTGFRVADRLAQKPQGGAPASSYFVGVHRPSAAPVLTAQFGQEVTSATASITFKFHWEYGGVKYQEQSITPTTISSTEFKFTPPAIGTDTPETAFPVLRMTAYWLTDNAQVFDLYTTNSSLDTDNPLYRLSLAKNSDDSYTVTLSTGVREEDKETRAYVFTQVNTYDEEGPPSDPAIVTTSPVVGVDVRVAKNQIPGYAPIKEIRIYRTGTGTTSLSYFYAGSVSVLNVDTAVFRDNVKAEMLNEPMASLDNYPPDQALKGLMTLPNGILCAWKDNEIHFSEAYKPWAWPPKYVKTAAHKIVGGIAHGSGAIVTTTGVPYMVSGVSPDSMTASKINVSQAGVSKWAIAVVDGAVVYASNDGLVTINGATGTLEPSQRFFTREVWRSKYGSGLSSMRFAVWDGRLVVYSSANAFTPFMLRFDEINGAMTELPSLTAQCSFTSVLSDQLYYAQGSTLYQFNGGSDAECVWQSREMVLPRPVNFGAGQLVCEGVWKIEFWVYVKTPAGVWQYQLKHTQIGTTGTYNFRLPSGFESDRYRIKIIGAGRFRELRVAQTARELANL